MNNDLKRMVQATGVTSDMTTDELINHLVENNRTLECRYHIAQLAAEDDRPFDSALYAIAEILPQGFENPECMAASIQIEDCQIDFKRIDTSGFSSTKTRCVKDIVLRGNSIGTVSVGYLPEPHLCLSEVVMFREGEIKLIESAARKIAYMVDRQAADQKKRLLEEQLRHADRLATIGQLAAGVAHELNNPLGDILGFAQLASNHPDLPEQIYQDLYKIVKSTLYAREVIKKMLLFSRQSIAHDGEVNLNKLIQDWADFFAFRCNQNDIELVMELMSDLPDIAGDVSQINQVVINLVVNAIHAMPNGGRLTVATEELNDRIMLKVTDTGLGIDASVRDKIFLPFFTTKEVDQGTGLGLAVVYGIVQEHGGEISFTSDVGKGTTFNVMFTKQRD